MGLTWLRILALLGEPLLSPLLSLPWCWAVWMLTGPVSIPGRYWETVERLRINQFYGAPTAIRLLLRYGDEWVKKYDRSSLKVLGSVGEPINKEAWEWYFRVVGETRCPVVDTWWQTGEMHMIPCSSYCAPRL